MKKNVNHLLAISLLILTCSAAKADLSLDYLNRATSDLDAKRDKIMTRIKIILKADGREVINIEKTDHAIYVKLQTGEICQLTESEIIYSNDYGDPAPSMVKRLLRSCRE
ncbi:MAG: hypothetical protein WA160_04055 [Pseudobdellovibrio sp.]